MPIIVSRAGIGGAARPNDLAHRAKLKVQSLASNFARGNLDGSQVSKGLPPSVRKAAAKLQHQLEDTGSAVVYKIRLDHATAVYVLRGAGESEDTPLKIFSMKGLPLASGSSGPDNKITWD